ncbi:DUF5689 domain-containing protein [Flavobacterium paronense]|uniref:DUF5689 domain-containing protein n=1 Tax=Flavobacterium paronense TaxID=1392775 RepID=A0ABV5GGH9_9FLAO|nr:DUF5689 domain-containing protein [Flavobacterium paronense]MDN3678528.1 DUF5689 domain-containing protein [Flavobacterium paronense]
MKKIILKSGLLLSLTIGLLSSCASDDHYSTPENTLVTYELTSTRTVASVSTVATATPVQFTTDDIIEAYVTSSDEKGTFYKSISFQTIPTDGSNPIGFSVPLNVTTLYGKGFIPGRKVFIKLNGLYSAIVYGSMQIGSLYQGTIGRISEFEWQDHLFPSATVVPESEMIRTLSLSVAYTDANQNTLVELDGVQFSDTSLNRTYYDVDSGGGATNHTLVSTTGTSGKIIRFSSFCPFTFNQVPKGSGKIRGVLTKYDTDFQFIVRYESDIKLTLDRFDTSPPIVGSALAYLGSFTENFESYSSTSPNNKIFPKYINDAVVGTRYWQTTLFGGNRYLQMTSFTSSTSTTLVNENNRSVFLIPVDLTAANTFSFQTKEGFSNGTVLKVYYILASDYTPGGIINNSKLVDITSSFTYSPGSSSGYPTNFTPSGNYNIPGTVTGNGYFVFEYIGSGLTGLTSTMQIDNVVVN